MIYPLAALDEIAGCFAIWAWWRGASVPWLLPGIVSLALFGWLLAQIEAGFAGRAYAAYGGVYIAASLFWMWGAEGQRPGIWDTAGACLCLIGAAVTCPFPARRWPRRASVPVLARFGIGVLIYEMDPFTGERFIEEID